MKTMKSKRNNSVKRLKEEIDFLNRGIKTKEETHDYLLKEKERQIDITKQLTYLLTSAVLTFPRG